MDYTPDCPACDPSTPTGFPFSHLCASHEAEYAGDAVGPEFQEMASRMLLQRHEADSEGSGEEYALRATRALYRRLDRWDRFPSVRQDFHDRTGRWL